MYAVSEACSSNTQASDQQKKESIFPLQLTKTHSSKAILLLFIAWHCYHSFCNCVINVFNNDVTLYHNEQSCRCVSVSKMLMAVNVQRVFDYTFCVLLTGLNPSH